MTKIFHFGFRRCPQDSIIYKAIDIPADEATVFINALVIDYNLPSKGSFTLGLTYSLDDNGK